MLKVHCTNRKMLDDTLRLIGGLVSEHPDSEGNYEVRAFPPEKIDFIKFAIENQGYAKIVK